MREEFYVLLEESGKVINEDKVSVVFNDASIEIMEIDDDDYNLYGGIYYSAFEAYDRINLIGGLNVA